FGIKKNNSLFINQLSQLIRERKENLPENSYTTKLFKEGADRIIQKVGEEAIETVIAAKNRDKEEIINETSDLIYHLLVMLAEQEIGFDEVVNKLISRHQIKPQ
ncbi:MAG: phosphoribosyl-ATP diphosphatase, partial [Melioribacteraceae bacterium]